MKKLSNSGNNSFLIRASLVTGLVIGFLIGGTFIYHAGSNESDTYQAVIFNTISGTATIVDPINFNIATEIPFEISPGQYGAHFNSKLNKLYLIHHGQSEILVLDPQTLEIKYKIPAGENIQHAGLFDEKEDVFFIVSRDTNSLILLNATSDRIISKIKVQEAPHHVALYENIAVVTNTKARTLSFIDINEEKIVKNIRLKSEPLMIVAGHENKKIFIGTAEQDDLARKIPARIVVFEDILDRLPAVVVGNRHSFIEPGEIILESTPHGLAVTEDDKNLLVTIPEMNKVLVIDVERLEIIKELETGKFPHNINIDPDGRFAYVTNSGDATVSIIDIQKMEVVSVVETGNGPQNVQFFNIMGELSNSGPNNQVRKVVSANFNCGG